MVASLLPFRTMLDEPVEQFSEPGSKIEDVWAMRLDEKGKEEFYIEGQTNVYEKIQAFKDEVDLENILRRVTDTGDVTLLNKRQGVYLDITETPKNLIDATNMLNRAEKEFMSLPVEVREKFENNFNKYLALAGTEEWAKNMGYIKEIIEETKEEMKGEETE